MTKKLTYRRSGVNIQKADEFVRNIGKAVRSTQSGGVISTTRAFASLFDLPKGLKDPVLASSTDGVGTKLLLANKIGKHDTVGIDLVAMNVNDILCVGAKPLFFLDYIACGKLHPNQLQQVVEGIAEGCRQAGCALVGGETAEMPGMYRNEEYDLAGFALGVVERKNIIDGAKIVAGDIILGLPSSGFHSNGYSLVRKVFSAREILKHAALIMEPTRIYVPYVLPLLGKIEIHGMAHNTGGAFYEKLTKCLPDTATMRIVKGSWPKPEVFDLFEAKAKVEEDEMYRTFNMGVGYALVLPAAHVERAKKLLAASGMPSFVIGEIVARGREKLELV